MNRIKMILIVYTKPNCILYLQILVQISERSMLEDPSNPIFNFFPDREKENMKIMSVLSKKAFKARTFINYDSNNNETTELFR